METSLESGGCDGALGLCVFSLDPRLSWPDDNNVIQPTQQDINPYGHRLPPR